MSLFDIIRYPITDIYKKDELDALPEDLYLEWFYRCAGKCPKAQIDSRVAEIKIMVASQAIQSIRDNQYRNTGNITFEDLWKAVFTKMLKKMIAEYEQE